MTKGHGTQPIRKKRDTAKSTKSTKGKRNAKKGRIGVFFSSVYTIRVHRKTTNRAQKQIRSFVVSGAALFCSALLFALLLLGFFSSVTLYTLLSGQMEENERELRIVRGELDALAEDSNRAAALAKNFRSIFDQTIEFTKIRSGYDTPLNDSTQLNVGVSASEARDYSQSRDISYVISTLSASLEPLSELHSLLVDQGALLADIPNLWPLAGNHGHVTMEFGPNRHPRSHQWYLHKGIDIAGSYGVGVLASANGKVIEAGYDRNGYGHYILLRHKYGFQTRYSHLSRIYITKGQEVEQGEPIGTVGNSGISTGPHLDFQIILGTDVIDPSLFLKISRRGFARWSGNRY